MNDGYGDFHSDQETGALFSRFANLDALAIDEIKSDIANYERRALDCRKRGNEQKAQEWDAKAAAAARELETYLPPRGGG